MGILTLAYILASFCLTRTSSSGNVTTVLRRNGESLRFLVMGDWGGLPDFPYRTPIERAVGREMGKIASQLDTQFLLALGDNFYYDGVKDVDDPRFYETYESIFTDQALQRPWYIVAGNHDWHGNVSAQILYSQRSKRWNYPDLYYALKFNIPGSQATVEILMIDTVVLCGDSDSDFTYKQPTMPRDFNAAQKQWAWIEKSLKNSKADYLIVAGHYPVYSIAEHGPTKCLVAQLEPMLHKYNVTAYFCGHEHNLEHLVYTDPIYKTTIDYFVSGSANFIDPIIKHANDVPKDSLRYYWADILQFGGFGYVEATPMNLTFTFLRTDGKLLHQKTMLPRKR